MVNGRKWVYSRFVGKAGRVYRMSDGLALAAQLCSDTPSQPAFGSARVALGQPYYLCMVHRVSIAR